MFQKNFSIKEFKEFLFDTIETLQTLDNYKVIPYVEKQLKNLIETDFLYLLSLEEGSNYNIPTLGKSISPSLSSKHLFSEVISKKQPLLLKDLKNSLLYDSSQDNIVDVDIEEVLLIPVKMSHATSKEYPKILVWAGLKQNSEYSFSQKQTLYLIKFLEGIKSHFSDVSNSHKLTIEQCLDNTETLERLISRNKQYFHSIIHDVRTPMNALIGFLDLLALNEIDAVKKDYLDSALKSGKHMVMLINDALDIAKIESGELPIEKQPFDLHDGLSDTVKIFYEAARKKSILLSAYIDPLIPKKIVSDQYRIKQVLSNLLSNAIKFTPENGHVLIEATYDKDRDIVTIAVQDTGIGIKKEALDDIFVAYRQESASTEKEYGGTGLGLNISYQIVSMLGGRLEVESDEGKGSRFYFELPSLSSNKEETIVDIVDIKKHLRLYKWDKREDIRSLVLKKYLTSFQSDIKMESQETTLKSIYKSGDYTIDDIFVIEHDYLDENDYEFAQLLLDRGCQIIWIEDIFDVTFNYFKGHIQKLSYPILTKNVYKVLHIQKDTKDNDKHKIEFKKDFKGKKILVVDDNRINLKFMEALMSKMGIKVELIDNAPSALLEMKEEQFDMLIIDENMPKMLGSEAISIIREDIKNGIMKDLAIVSLSGDSHHQNRIKESGANEVLTKPVSIEQLNGVLEKYLL
jgi:signal transduction histidine kinase